MVTASSPSIRMARKLNCIVDPYNVFGEDLSLLTVKPFEDHDYASFEKADQQTENKLPCAFIRVSRRP
jgi:hypothetical protein